MCTFGIAVKVCVMNKFKVCEGVRLAIYHCTCVALIFHKAMKYLLAQYWELGVVWKVKTYSLLDTFLNELNFCDIFITMKITTRMCIILSSPPSSS